MNHVSAPTEPIARAPETASAARATKETAPTIKAAPAGEKRSAPSERTTIPPAKRADGKAAPRGPTNAIQRVEQGIRAAGVPLAMNWGRDGKRLDELLGSSGADVTTDDVIGCYVAIATRQYGDDFMRRRLSVTTVCAEWMPGYLSWVAAGRPAPLARAGPRGKGGGLSFEELMRGES